MKNKMIDVRGQFSSPLIWGAVVASALAVVCAPQVGAQGCVAGRCPAGAPLGFQQAGLELGERPFAGLQTSFGYRWLRSDRHFIGNDEQEEREEQGSEVVNELGTFNFGFNYALTPRYGFALDVAWVENERSSPVYLENNRELPVVGRWNSGASGFGDMRLGLHGWLWDPAAHASPHGRLEEEGAPAASSPVARRGNLRISLGLDLPTGEKDVMSYRKTYRDGRIVSTDAPQPVDQSIQPGDGGWGIPIDLYGYFQLTETVSTYLQASYLVTPETDNGVPTLRSNPFEAVMSIGDTFMVRSGVEWTLSREHGVTVGLGLRSEGQPVEDLVGSSDGFRRPGMNIAVEPSLSWMKNGWSASLSVPVVFYNERFQSVPDQQWQDATGIPRHGDASFADYYVMLSVGRQF